MSISLGYNPFATLVVYRHEVGCDLILVIGLVSSSQGTWLGIEQNGDGCVSYTKHTESTNKRPQSKTEWSDYLEGKSPRMQTNLRI